MLVWLTCKWPMMSLSSQNSQKNCENTIIDYLLCVSIVVGWLYRIIIIIIISQVKQPKYMCMYAYLKLGKICRAIRDLDYLNCIVRLDPVVCLPFIA